MTGETNHVLLNRIDKNLDTVTKEVAAMKLDVALKFSNIQNSQDKRYLKIEAYLQSDPTTNQEGAIEKLERIERSVNDLETNAKIQGAKYGGAISIIVSVLWWIISKIVT